MAVQVEKFNSNLLGLAAVKKNFHTRLYLQTGADVSVSVMMNIDFMH
jgi:hypothetical protein